MTEPEIKDDLEKPFFDMTPEESAAEKRMLVLSIGIKKEEIDNMTRTLKRLRTMDFEIEFRRKELMLLEKQKQRDEKFAEHLLT